MLEVRKSTAAEAAKIAREAKKQAGLLLKLSLIANYAQIYSASIFYCAHPKESERVAQLLDDPQVQDAINAVAHLTWKDK